MNEETILLERYRFAATTVLDKYDMFRNKFLDPHIIVKKFMDNLVFMMEDFMWEETGLEPTKVIYPLNWWEGLKECIYRWKIFPSYLKKKYPVKYMNVIVEFHAVYPNFKQKIPGEKCVIHRLERYERDSDDLS